MEAANGPMNFNEQMDDILSKHSLSVKPEWIDHNNHMNLAYYPMAFYGATAAFSLYLGMDRAFKKRTSTASFLADMHLSYKREVVGGDPLIIYSRLINFDKKRIHFWHQMHHAEKGHLVATCEMLSLNIDTKTRSVAAMPEELSRVFSEVLERHSQLPIPGDIGRSISIG